MNDLGLMHYYLGLEVWKKLGEIYLGQGKYMIKILCKFGMMDRKSMMTPMITNLRKLGSSNSNPMDPTCYKRFIGSLMYLLNTKTEIFSVINVHR